MLLILLAVAGCGSDTNVAEGADLAVCASGIGAPPSAATSCGLLTCAPGQVCVYHQPGAPSRDLAFPVDGGSADAGAPADDPLHHCMVLPPECQLCGGCGDGTPGSGGKQFGCFTTICTPGTPWYETGCRFDGATLTCIGL